MTPRKNPSLVIKRCAKCGEISRVAPAVRRCRHQRFGPRSYMCWGLLERQKTTAPAPDVQAAVDTSPAGLHSRGEAYRSKLLKKLLVAQAKVKYKKRKIAQATARLKAWQLRAVALQRRAAWTDEQVEAMRLRMVRAAQVRAVGQRLIKAAGLQAKEEEEHGG